MLKTMQRGCTFLLLLAAVVTARSHPFSLSRSSRDIPEDCQNALIVCAIPAIMPYVGLNETQIQDRIRDTPLSEHCSDWTSAVECIRQEIQGGSCSDVDASRFANLLGAVDFALTYVCKDNFDKINRNFRCLASREVRKETESSCKLRENDEDDKCALIIELIDCSAGVVKSECGNEASSITKDFGTKLLEKVDDIVLETDCSTSGRTNRLALFKKFLAGM